MKLHYKYLNQWHHRKRPWRIDRDGYNNDEFHCHMKKKKHAITLITLLKKGILPSNADFRISAKKLLTEKEFSEFKEE